jgi:phospholipid transport system substrate-binding protein
MKRRLRMGMSAGLLALGLLMSLWPMPLVAGPATDQVKATVDEVLRILQAPEYRGPARAEARRSAIRRAITERFGFEEMARRSLGINWAARSPAERKEFVQLFTDLLERSYLNRIESYTDEQVVYLDEAVEGDRAEVRSKIITRGDEVPVNYRLSRRGNDWEVYDIVIEGVSLVNNYRSQFSRIINQSSYSALVQRMRRQAQGAAAEQR